MMRLWKLYYNNMIQLYSLCRASASQQSGSINIKNMYFSIKFVILKLMVRNDTTWLRRDRKPARLTPPYKNTFKLNISVTC